MRRTLLALALGVALGALGMVAAAEVAGGWYRYEFLSPVLCERFMRGQADISPAEVAPGQPHACLVRYRRFSLA